MEFIILAGGLGTRLQGVIGDQPKSMATVDGRPFLHYLLEYLAAQGCERVILSLGFRYEAVMEWLHTYKSPMPVDVVIETEPLGTGGGIRLAMEQAKGAQVGVMNGDTMFRVDMQELLSFHNCNAAETTVALKEMHNFSRYGVVNTDSEGRITTFEEKEERSEGMINGGVYIMDKAAFMSRELPEMFSFEKEYLEQYAGEGKFYGYGSNGYFIDIGIPADYKQAQEDFKIQLK